MQSPATPIMHHPVIMHIRGPKTGAPNHRLGTGLLEGSSGGGSHAGQMGHHYVVPHGHLPLVELEYEELLHP